MRRAKSMDTLKLIAVKNANDGEPTLNCYLFSYAKRAKRHFFGLKCAVWQTLQ